MVLNPTLFALLKDTFNDDVGISNEDEEMLSDVYEDAYTGKLQRNPYQSGQYFTASCPFCNDTRKRLWINHRWGVKDPETGSLNLYLAHCFNEECLQQSGRSWELYRMVYTPFTHELGEDLLVPAHRPAPARIVKWPGRQVGIGDLWGNHPCRLYLDDRGFDVALLASKLHVNYCLEASADYGLAQSRIIIPVCMGGQLKGWQARYVGEPDDKNVPKYFNMPGMKKSELLYNYDTARQYPFVLLCEGVTDVWKAGPASVAMFGKTLSAMQKALIGTAWANGTAVVLLDGDASTEAQEIYRELEGVVRQRVLVSLPEGSDPGGLPAQVLAEQVANAARKQGIVLPVHR